jgi:NAD(P)H-flavin reductase
MGIVAPLTAIGDRALALPAGSYADRRDRKRVLVAADLGRAALSGLMRSATAVGFAAAPAPAHT